MSNRISLGYTSIFVGDGTSTSLIFDLKKFPNGTSFGQEYIDFSKTPNPTGVSPNGGDISFTASVSGTVVTLSFSTTPVNGQRYSFSLILDF